MMYHYEVGCSLTPCRLDCEKSGASVLLLVILNVYLPVWFDYRYWPPIAGLTPGIRGGPVLSDMYGW